MGRERPYSYVLAFPSRCLVHNLGHGPSERVQTKPNVPHPIYLRKYWHPRTGGWSTMTQEVSPAAFTLGQFDRTSYRGPLHQDLSQDRDSISWRLNVYVLGCRLEERVLLAQGMRLGIFPTDPVIA